MTDHGLPLPHARGEVRLSPTKVLWNGTLCASLVVAPFVWDPAAVAFSALTAAFILCVGHSVGFHRGVIHRAFRMGPWTERAFAWLAILAGIGGPLGMLRMHNTRDTHQNHPEAPDYYTFAHAAWRDATWYLFCEHTGVPAAIPADKERDPWFRALEATWRLQHLVIAVALYALGGLPWLVWGAGVRTAVCVLGHWYVNYAAHTRGYRRWRMPGSGEEGRNHLVWGMLAMGEGWHNNHHAWPDSARFSVGWWEVDPGWLVVRALAAVGLVWDVKTWERGATLRDTAIPQPMDLLDAFAEQRAR